MASAFLPYTTETLKKNLFGCNQLLCKDIGGNEHLSYFRQQTCMRQFMLLTEHERLCTTKVKTSARKILTSRIRETERAAKSKKIAI